MYVHIWGCAPRYFSCLGTLSDKSSDRVSPEGQVEIKKSVEVNTRLKIKKIRRKKHKKGRNCGKGNVPLKCGALFTCPFL